MANIEKSNITTINASMCMYHVFVCLLYVPSNLQASTIMMWLPPPPPNATPKWFRCIETARPTCPYDRPTSSWFSGNSTGPPHVPKMPWYVDAFADKRNRVVVSPCQRRYIPFGVEKHGLVPPRRSFPESHRDWELR